MRTEIILLCRSSVPCADGMYSEAFISLGFKSGGMSPLPFSGFDDMASSGNAGIMFPSIQHKDAFLIFRALCKLSMKGLQDDSGTHSDPIALQNKYVLYT